MADGVVFDEERGGRGLFGFKDLDQFVFGWGGRGFFGFRFFLCLKVFSCVFGFTTELFVEVFGLLFFDRWNSSFFHVFVHVNVGGIGTLVIFEFILVTTGLAPAIVF